MRRKEKKRKERNQQDIPKPMQQQHLWHDRPTLALSLQHTHTLPPSPSFVVWHFLILLSVITLFSLSFLPCSLLLMMLNEDWEEKSAFVIFSSALQCYAWTCIIFIFNSKFFFITQNTADYDDGNTERPILWNGERGVFWKSKFFISSIWE